jgi:RNA polymerase sigma-70 factor (ECF subfamily)
MMFETSPASVPQAAAAVAPDKRDLMSRREPNPAIDYGHVLRQLFATLSVEPLPTAFADLLSQLERAEQPQRLGDAEFKKQLAAMLPHLRAFGRSLSGSRDLADDLVQETMMKAWAARDRFQAGTNMRAWTFIILRNLFLSQMRRKRFTGEYDELQADRILVTKASQSDSIDLGDVQRAMLALPTAQREALILVGAGGLAYEEAAEICQCAVGTIKSRVARARTALAALLTSDGMPSRTGAPDGPRTSTFDQIMGEADELARR